MYHLLSHLYFVHDDALPFHRQLRGTSPDIHGFTRLYVVVGLITTCRARVKSGPNPKGLILIDIVVIVFSIVRFLFRFIASYSYVFV